MSSKRLPWEKFEEEMAMLQAKMQSNYQLKDTSWMAHILFCSEDYL